MLPSKKKESINKYLKKNKSISIKKHMFKIFIIHDVKTQQNYNIKCFIFIDILRKFITPLGNCGIHSIIDYKQLTLLSLVS